MTQLKTVEEVARLFMGMELDSYNVFSAMRADRLAISTALVEALEGKKRDQDAPKPGDPHFTGCGGCGEDYKTICGCREVNQALTEAQNIIRTLLESKN